MPSNEEPAPKPRRRPGNIRKTIRLYREAATPDVYHRAVKTTWQGVTGGGITGLGAAVLLDLSGSVLTKIALGAITAVGGGVTAFITNLLAEVDKLLQPAPNE
jgi:hypothetical protein